MTENTVGICLQGTLCVAPMAPFITGDITVPNTLTGQLISNVMYQWVRDVDDIAGATSQTYILTAADVGHLIRVRMYFTDADNNFHCVISKPVGPIQGPLASPVVFQGNQGHVFSASPIVATLPAGVTAGDLLLSTIVNVGVNAVFSISAGWTIIDQSNSAALSGATAYRIATGSGDAPTWSWTGGGQASPGVSRFTGNSTTTPIGNHSVNAGSGTMISATPITSAGGGTFNLYVLNAHSQTVPLPSGWYDLWNGIEATDGYRTSALDVAETTDGPVGIDAPGQSAAAFAVVPSCVFPGPRIS